jgi:hypothetical protein
LAPLTRPFTSTTDTCRVGDVVAGTTLVTTGDTLQLKPTVSDVMAHEVITVAPDLPFKDLVQVIVPTASAPST